MDSSNSVLNVKVWDLRNSPHPEDHETAGAYEQLLGEILAKLKPILRYVCTPVDFYNAAGISGTRCFLVGTYDRGHEWEKDTPVHVFLSETGAFFEAQKQAFLIARKSDKLCMLGAGGADGTDVAKVLTEGYNDPFCTWNQLPFLDLLTGLQATLEEAERKRRQHLEAVATRNSFLKRMLATAQNFSMVPYRRFRQWREVTLGTYRSNEAIARDLENHGIPMVDPTPEILRAIPVREYGKTEEIDLANVSPKELGFTVEPTRDEITTRAEQFGLVIRFCERARCSINLAWIASSGNAHRGENKFEAFKHPSTYATSLGRLQAGQSGDGYPFNSELSGTSVYKLDRALHGAERDSVCWVMGMKAWNSAVDFLCRDSVTAPPSQFQTTTGSTLAISRTILIREAECSV